MAKGEWVETKRSDPQWYESSTDQKNGLTTIKPVEPYRFANAEVTVRNDDGSVHKVLKIPDASLAPPKITSIAPLKAMGDISRNYDREVTGPTKQELETANKTLMMTIDNLNTRIKELEGRVQQLSLDATFEKVKELTGIS